MAHDTGVARIRTRSQPEGDGGGGGERHARQEAGGEFVVAGSDTAEVLEAVRGGVALDAITRSQATFTTRDLATFAFRHSDGKDQFDQVMGAVRASPELIALGRDGRDQERFTSRDMIAVETRLERSAGELAGADHHFVAGTQVYRALDVANARG